MEFLSPLYLAAASLAAVPLLIHLLRRRIGVRVEFPAVRYLARAEREHSRKLRLRNLFLMLLRVLVVLLIAAAAARPVVRITGGGAGAHAPTALAIVLDNSLSTSALPGGRAVLDVLRNQARAAVDRAARLDRVWLVTADGVVHGGERDAVRDAIDHVDPLAGAGSPSRALLKAGGLVEAAPFPARQILVLTDGQATTWASPVLLGGEDVVVSHLAAAPPVNHAVVAASGVPVRWTPRGAVHARVLTPDSATYRIILGGRTLARGTVARDEEIVVRAAPPERGWTVGAVELEPDELRGDDRRWFAVWIGPAPAVSARPSVGPFVRTALDALTQAERVVSGNDIAITPADEATRLPALLVAPSDPVKIGAANRTLERLGVPWRFGAPRHGVAAPVRAGAGERPLEGVTATSRYLLRSEGPPSGDTLATAGGEPWIVGGQRYVLIGSPLDRASTDFPVKAAFVPWLDEMLSQRLSEDAGPLLTAAPGEEVVRPPGADQLEQPSGTRLSLSTDTLVAPDRTGVYFFLAGGARTGALAVNAEPEESELRRLDDSTLARRIRAHRVTVVTDSAVAMAGLFDASPRRPLLALLLILALAGLVAESIEAATGQRRRGG